MKINEMQINIAKKLEKIAEIYTQYSLSDVKFSNQFRKKNGFLALTTFIPHAYERNIDLSTYKACALETLSEYKNKINWENPPSATDSKLIWTHYQKVAIEKYKLINSQGGPKVNPDRNPMNSDGGVVSLLSSKKIHNLATYVKELLETNKVKEAYAFVDKIRGVGPKITSFYLRDIAYLLSIDETQIENSDLLQPIDIWIERVLEIIFPTTKFTNYKQERMAIIELCNEAKVSAIAFNQGAWEFGSRIAENQDRLNEALKDEVYFVNLIHSKIIEYEETIVNSEEIIEKNKKYLKILKNVKKII